MPEVNQEHSTLLIAAQSQGSPEQEKIQRNRLAAALVTAEARLACLQRDVARLTALQRELAIGARIRRELSERLEATADEVKRTRQLLAAWRAESETSTQIWAADRDKLKFDLAAVEHERQQLQATLHKVLSSRAWRLAEQCRRPLDSLRAVGQTLAGRRWRNQGSLTPDLYAEGQLLPTQKNQSEKDQPITPELTVPDSANAACAHADQQSEPVAPVSPVSQLQQPSEEEMIVSRFDCTEEQFRFLREQNASTTGFRRVRRILWFLPYFENPFYGGIFTILRFAQHWYRTRKVENAFAICHDENVFPTCHVDRDTMLVRLRAAYPPLEDWNFFTVPTPEQAVDLPKMDASICTLWTTPYFAAHHRQSARRFYLIQDFEPSFYRAGSTSAIVEATYRMGLYGIANTISLKKTYESEYGGKAAYFRPCVDCSLFYPPSARCHDPERPFKVFLYGRPGQPRNAFALLAAAMKLVKESLLDRVHIYSAGAEWNPSEYGLHGIVENLGLLKYQDTAEFYRETDVGVVMMLSRHPSYIPFELMASGCLVVTNINPYTSWLLKDRCNCLLTRTTASAVAETVKLGLLDHSLRTKIIGNAASLIQSEYSSWSTQMDDIYDYLCDPETYLQTRSHE